ncbi:MAG: hypothetical protein Q8S32_02610 [Burkholderiaceae bacterium]|nr:hypothetical protein [Burkholderiaceae bacterium]MDP3132937.1 hypothetical protein [Burkholderiaceae bacterium]MDP3422635.1 hypothetical protein [Burkholderiaceae bacterium]
MKLFAWPGGPKAPDATVGSSPLAAPVCPSTSVGAETVRGITLMLVAACLATVVLVTQRVLQGWVGDDVFLTWTVTWCVLLGAMQWLLRSAAGWSRASLQWLDTWAQRIARQRAQHRAGATVR